MRKLNVNTAMSRPQKSTPQAKRVAPPAVPSLDLHNRNSGVVTGTFVVTTNNSNNSGSNNSSNIGNPRNNCPGYSSIEDGGFTQTRESPAALSIKDEIIEYTASTQSPANNIVTVVNTNKSPNNLNPYVTPTAFTFPISGREPLTHKAAVFYHQQLALQEDQGIDLTQSPGRDSPGSSSGSAGSGSRHSTASLDSGRASSYITSGGGSTTSTRGALSSPRCSVSSCSIGSVDRMSQRSDNDIIIEWLSDMKFDEYAQLFTAAGYDLPTITRMTPEDLTAIGIKNPHHRERIKQHIDNLQLPDGLPNFVPGSIEEWLRLLRLEEYIQPLLDQNYKTVRDVTQVTWEDLEDIGIVKLGHQKKILLAIKRVKDIISGKWNLKGGNNQQHQQQSTPTSSSAQKDYNNIHHHNNNYFQNNNHFYNNNNNHQNGEHNNNNNKIVFGSQPHQYEQQQSRISWDDSRSQEIYNEYSGVNHESNGIVLIKIRQPRGKSLESLEDISERNTRTHLTFSHYSTDYTYFPQHMQMHPAHQMQQQQQIAHLQQQQHPGINKHLCMNSSLPYHVGNLQWRRSYDDGDITPTNEIASDLNEGGGTLPRQRSGNPSARCRLLDNCTIVGSSLSGSTCSNNSGGNSGSVTQSHLINSGDYNTCPSQQDNVIIMSNAVRYSAGCSPLPNKRTAPEPPRRQCSVRQTGRSASVPEQSIILSQQQQNLIQQQQQYYIHQQQQQNNSNNTGCRNSQQYIPPQHFQQQIQQQPIYVNYSTVHQTTAEIHCDKTHDSKSNSSIDSIDTIPFANENTGTIKQRLLNRQDISSSLSLSSSSSSSSSTNTVANIAQSFNSLKTSGSLHETALHNIIGNNNPGGGSSNSSCCGGNNSADHTPPSPTVPSPPIPSGSQQIDSYHNLHHSEIGLDDDCGGQSSNISSVDGVIVPKCGNNNDGTIIKSINPNDSVNVLNDIGNMLANLTDELDAMLEEEKRVGISDSE